MTSNFVHAQVDIKNLEKVYNVKIDSVLLKGTPYKKIEKNGVIYDEEKKIDWYNDITIYEISSNKDESKSSMKSDSLPAVFMLPGGGFFGISPDDTSGMDIIGNLTLGSKLVSSLPSKVYVIKYLTNPSNYIGNVVFAWNVCDSTQNETGKALLIEASYKAFHDLRKILKVNYLDSAAIKQIDPDNFFMIGSSAGAVLIINSLFLQKEEIETPITYKTNCTGTTVYGSPITITSNIINDYWPIPTMKGVVSMAGAWIYDNVSYLTENTPATTYDTPIYLMHGTCDEIIHRRDGNIGFKLLPSLNQNNIPNKFLNGKGSEYIFNAFKESHEFLGYGQVLRGGHGVFSNNILKPAWDIESIFFPKDSVTSHIKPFISDLIGGTSLWDTHAEVLKPDKNGFCKGFDEPIDTICYQRIVRPWLNYKMNLCGYSTETAIMFNLLPSLPYTVTWTAVGNVTIIGSNIGTTIQYKRLNATNTNGTLKAIIQVGCHSEEFIYAINITENPIEGIYMDYPCGYVYMGSDTWKLKNKSSVTFNAYYGNGSHEGVSSLDWTVNCGSVIFSGNYTVGFSLTSIYKIKTGIPCTSTTVSHTNECGVTKSITGNLINGTCTYRLLIYPNPTNSYFNIDLDNGEILLSPKGMLVSIYDPMGNKVAENLILSTSEKIDVSNLRQGVYNVTVTVENEQYFSSFIKK